MHDSLLNMHKLIEILSPINYFNLNIFHYCIYTDISSAINSISSFQSNSPDFTGQHVTHGTGNGKVRITINSQSQIKGFIRKKKE